MWFIQSSVCGAFSGAFKYPKMDWSINMHEQELFYNLPSLFVPLASEALCFSNCLFFCYLCAAKCLEPVLAVTQHVGNRRRRVKEGEEFIKPRTTSQSVLTYHIVPHLSQSVSMHTWTRVCVRTYIITGTDTCRHTQRLTHKLPFAFSASLSLCTAVQTDRRGSNSRSYITTSLH